MLGYLTNRWPYLIQAKINYLIQLTKILCSWGFEKEGFWSETALFSHRACTYAELLIRVSNLLLQAMKTLFNARDPCLDTGAYWHCRCSWVSHYFQLPAWKGIELQRSCVVSAMSCKYPGTLNGTCCLSGLHLLQEEAKSLAHM